MTVKRTVLDWLGVFGVNPGVTKKAFTGLPRYFREEAVFRSAMLAADCDIPLGRRYPILQDYGDSAGAASGHYFHMDLWAARRIHAMNPVRHVDVGSRVDGFIAHLLAFREVEVLDIRPLQSSVEGLTFVQGDATELSGVAEGAWSSISSLHAAEHFGLGRYGDPLDPWGYRRLIASLTRVLAPGGRLYFAVPIGRERVEFNAHRVFDPMRILSDFSGLTLLEFSAVNDDGTLSRGVEPADYVDAELACGLFEFTKTTAHAG